MYITHNINDFDIDNIFFNKSVNNTVINNGKFSRVIYSNSLYTINSLLYVVKLSNITIEQNFNRYKCFFPINKNRNIIDKICNIENIILDYCDIDSKKNKKLCIQEQLDTGCIKFFENNNSKNIKEFILKISGVWETDKDIGLTFKFMLLKSHN